MPGDIAVQDAAPIMADDEEALEHTESKTQVERFYVPG
jgi:hypothetical protein